MEWVELKGKSDLRLPATANRGGTVFLGLLIAVIGIGGLFGGEWLLAQEAPSDDFHKVMFGMGVLFVLFGLFVIRTGWKGMREQRRVRARRRRHPHSPWFADFDWDETGIQDAMHLRWRRQVGAIPLMALFVVPANLVFFDASFATVAPILAVALFDLALIWVIAHTIYLYLQDRKYATSRLRFDRFPFKPGGTIEVRLRPVPFSSCTATLRYLLERFESRGSGKSRRRSHVTYQLYGESRLITLPGRTTELPLRFELPDEPEWTTRLTGDSSVRYWELHFEADQPGIDFETSFPLPVYRSDPTAIREEQEWWDPEGTPRPTPVEKLPTRSFGQAIRHDSGRLMIGVVMIAIALSVPLLIWWGSTSHDDILEHGIAATATVTDKRTRSGSGSKSTSYVVDYTFKLATGETRRDSNTLEKSLWSAIDPGDRLDILYDPEPPHRSLFVPDPAKQESLLSRILLYLFVGLFVTFWSGFFGLIGYGLIYSSFKEGA
jgi:hypothetical protein